MTQTITQTSTSLVPASKYQDIDLNGLTYNEQYQINQNLKELLRKKSYTARSYQALLNDYENKNKTTTPEYTTTLQKYKDIKDKVKEIRNEIKDHQVNVLDRLLPPSTAS